METIIKIAIGCNLFLAGYHYSKQVEWANGRTETIKALIWVALQFLFGSVILIASIFWELLSMGCKKLNGQFQVMFWIDFYLLKKYDNLEENQLQTINRISTNVRNKNTVKDRIYRYCTRLINVRNKYTYAHTDAEF